MKRIYQFLFFLFFIAPLPVFAQSVKFSDYEKEDNRDINFEIIGKLNSNILVYKNNRYKHKINIYDKDMNTLETVRLDFIPEKTYNIDFVPYNDYFFIIYQYQKGSILHCMAVKMDANAKKMYEPVEVDTTAIPFMADNKIYKTIYSEDRKKIMIFKIQTRYQIFNLQTILFDSDMKLLERNRFVTDYNVRKENYDNFLITNDGCLVFTNSRQSNVRDNSNGLGLYTKEQLKDSFAYHEIELNEKYIDEVKLKIDNRNKRFIINTFYYKKSRSSIEGLFTYIWDREKEKTHTSKFIQLYDSLRYEAKSNGMLTYAFDDYFIRNIVVKADGGFILAAEDFSSDTRDNSNFNRYDYLYNPYSTTSGSYYYNPYTGYYRPLNSYINQSTRYYYDNILVMGISKNGVLEWSKVIQKSQYDDNEENFLSYSIMTSGSELHLLYNVDKKFQIVSNQSLSADGTIKRYATLKSPEKTYEFMTGLSKQVGANQIIIPCAYRYYICFAKVDF